MKGEVDILANFPIDTSLKKKAHSALSDKQVPLTAQASFVSGLASVQPPVSFPHFSLVSIISSHPFSQEKTSMYIENPSRLVGFTLYSECVSVCLTVCPLSTFVTYFSFSICLHTNHIFSESLSSGDDNDRHKDLQKDKDTQTKKNTKCFQDPMYAISL